MKFGGAKSDFGEDPPDVDDERKWDNGMIDGGSPLGPSNFQKRILKTAEEELSRPFAKDHSFVNIEHDEVLINEIDP